MNKPAGKAISFIYSHGISCQLFLIKTRPVCNELSFLATRSFTTPLLSQGITNTTRNTATNVQPSSFPPGNPMHTDPPRLAHQTHLKSCSAPAVCCYPPARAFALSRGCWWARVLSLECSHGSCCNLISSIPSSNWNSCSHSHLKIACCLFVGKHCFIFASTLHVSDCENKYWQ